MLREAFNSPSSAPPLLHHDNIDLRCLGPWGKKKRSKRPRIENPPTEEGYLALCLLMLARGADNNSPPPPPMLELSYKCSICHKTFSSYQAKGGHKASTGNSSELTNNPPTSQQRLHQMGPQLIHVAKPICVPSVTEHFPPVKPRADTNGVTRTVATAFAQPEARIRAQVSVIF